MEPWILCLSGGSCATVRRRCTHLIPPHRVHSPMPHRVQVVKCYGADALRLYLINSPVVRAEPLRFEEKGVKDVVKTVFLPWYNAYRFLAQNAVRVAAEGGKFDPRATLAANPPSNVLDRWIKAATRTLVNDTRKQMEQYKLYNVVPHLLTFIDALTNVYVRYNRKRLKGRGRDAQDGEMALATLFDTLLKARSQHQSYNIII